MSTVLGRRIRWATVFVLVGGWFVGLAMNVGGNAVHLLLAAAAAVLIYELAALDPPS